MHNENEILAALASRMRLLNILPLDEDTRRDLCNWTFEEPTLSMAEDHICQIEDAMKINISPIAELLAKQERTMEDYASIWIETKEPLAFTTSSGV